MNLEEMRALTNGSFVAFHEINKVQLTYAAAHSVDAHGQILRNLSCHQRLLKWETLDMNCYMTYGYSLNAFNVQLGFTLKHKL